MARRPTAEQGLTEQAASALRAAGFPFVQTEVPLPGVKSTKHRMRADVVAWDVDGDGELRPRLLVEAENAFPARMQKLRGEPKLAALQQLAAYANIFGTRESYVFDESGWHVVAPTYDRMERIEAPHPWGNELTGTWPNELVKQLVVSSLWRRADALRGEHGADELGWRAVRNLLAHLDGGEVEGSLEQVLASSSGRRAVVRAVCDDGLPRFRGRGSYETPWELATAMARLANPVAGQTIVDPFCGMGTCLWAAAELAAGAHLRGRELNHQAAELARRFGKLGRYDVEVITGDSFENDAVCPSDLVITSPPIGMKPEATALEAGGRTRDGDAIILDRILQWLLPNGRAVLLTAPGVLFRGGTTERVRSYISNQLRVVSVITLPAGVLAPATMIPLAILVLERAQPSETLVARLGDDWQEQLSEGGAFMGEYRRHLADPSK